MAEQFIFNGDAQESFYAKLDSLHEKYVYHLLLSGVAPLATDLESIKMTKSPRVSDKYCKRVVGGLLNVKPKITARLVEDGALRLECMFTTLNDNEYVNDELFMIQNVIDYPQINKFSCQVWYLAETSMNQIKEHWNE